jgi:hypothetical protein
MISNIDNKPAEIRFGVVSDIHTGHKRTKTAFILDNLNRHVASDEFLSSIDILFIAGDFYDGQMSTYSEEYAQIGKWIAHLLRKCHRYGVVVRVLEGTKSHDRGQGIQFVTINELNEKAGKKAVDLKYVDTLSIEYLQKFGLMVLYVPDDWAPNTQDTLDQVKALLAKHNIDSVDIAIMHGQFPHQIPAGMGHIPMHNDEEYSKIVRRAIFIGHHHTSTQYGKIYAQGSFDRLAHNEEEPKGFFKVVLTPDSHTVTFIENTHAAVYKTISCDADSVTDNLLKIDEIVQDIPNGANLRIEASLGNPILDNMAIVKERWPLHTWTEVVRGKDKKQTKPLIDHKLVYVPVTLDRQTLHPTLLARLTQKGYEPEQIDRCAELLAQITGGAHGNPSRTAI